MAFTSAFQANAFQNNAFQIVVSVQDTHDGIWDERLYRKYQEQLRKQRAKTLAEERRDDERKPVLRKELLRLYRGLPEEHTEKAKVEAKVELKEVKQPEDAYRVLNAISKDLETAQQRLIQEYQGLLARETLRAAMQAEMDEEDELETIITALL